MNSSKPGEEGEPVKEGGESKPRKEGGAGKPGKTSAGVARKEGRRSPSGKPGRPLRPPNLSVKMGEEGGRERAHSAQGRGRAHKIREEVRALETHHVDELCILVFLPIPFPVWN